jgi:hypothetical protein
MDDTPQEDSAEYPKFAEGVFIAMTGGAVYDFEPKATIDGYNAYAPEVICSAYGYAVDVLGFADPFDRHWSDDPKHYRSEQ